MRKAYDMSKAENVEESPDQDGQGNQDDRDERLLFQSEFKALESVFEDVRGQSKKKLLVHPERWQELELIPDHLSFEDFEMLVYDFLKKDLGEEKDAESNNVTPSFEYDDIGVIVGGRSYYLYDQTVFTKAYARWLFLATENDAVATLVECAREESRIYPRPLSAKSLMNAPFLLTETAIEAAWLTVSQTEECQDIERTLASNGDVYYYSTEHLSPTYAASLAEWQAVERDLNR